MKHQTTLSSFVMIASLSLTGCAALHPNTAASQYESETTNVDTEHSGALQCLGNMVNQSDFPTLTVYVKDIDDETVPRRFRERRLSKGGAWWFHTAISKMETDKVVSTLDKPEKGKDNGPFFIVLQGAWTQDDLEIGSNNQSFGFNNLGGGILDRLGYFKREKVSVIAGDFVSTKNDKVIHASAISLAVTERDNNLEMRIDDGSRRFDLGVNYDVNEGPQFAQRRIAEAAALVHIANAFELDYSNCMVSEKAPAVYEG